MAKVNKSIRLMDQTTGKRIWKPQPRSLLTAREAARRIAKSTGHVVEVWDQFGLYYRTSGTSPNPRRKKRNAGGPLDTSAARELELFIENDSQLYNSQEKPIQKNLVTKMARGVYNHAGAVKLYGYLMESGAKKYVKEHGSPGDSWHQMFSPATRKAAAERFAQSFETEAKLGNYDAYLPKKYVGWRDKQSNPHGGSQLFPAKIVMRNGKAMIAVTPAVMRKMNPHGAGGWLDSAFSAGQDWGRTGQHTSGVANTRVRHYGFVKFFNNIPPREPLQVTKARLEKAFNEGFKSGKRQ